MELICQWDKQRMMSPTHSSSKGKKQKFEKKFYCMDSILSPSLSINTRCAKRSVHLLHSTTRLSCNVLQIIVFSMSRSEKIINQYRTDWFQMIFLASPINLAWRHGWPRSLVGGESRNSPGKVKNTRSTRKHHIVHIFHQESRRWSGEGTESISGKLFSSPRSKWLVSILQRKMVLMWCTSNLVVRVERTRSTRSTWI